MSKRDDVKFFRDRVILEVSLISYARAHNGMVMVALDRLIEAAEKEGARKYRVERAMDDELGHPGECSECGEPYEWVRPGKTQATCECGVQS